MSEYRTGTYPRTFLERVVDEDGEQVAAERLEVWGERGGTVVVEAGCHKRTYPRKAFRRFLRKLLKTL